MEKGEVILLLDGRMLRIQEKLVVGSEELAVVLFVDAYDEGYFNISEIYDGKNLGQSAPVLASFYSARSIHSRLNGFRSI